MLKEVTIGEILNTPKTLVGYKSSWSNRQMVLLFSDGTFITLGIEYGHEHGDEEIIWERLEIESFGDDSLIQMGIITQEECDERDRQRQEKYNDLQRKQRYNQYLNLKAEFDK